MSALPIVRSHCVLKNTLHSQVFEKANFEALSDHGDPVRVVVAGKHAEGVGQRTDVTATVAVVQTMSRVHSRASP